MVRRTVCILCLIPCLLLLSLVVHGADQKHNITGPITHENLSIFLIHGKNTYSIDNMLTLKEAIEQKKIIIHETEEVNELQVENISNYYIFIQEGDIVKGGKQDRVLQYDFVVNPKSSKIPISSFCVEQQRWSKRGKEDLGRFNSSSKRIASKKLKLATKQEQSQQKVWEEVKEVQDKLSSNVGTTVNSAVSASSLQLALENKEIAVLTKEYINNINKQIKDDRDIIGFVFAINGEINSGDIYSNNVLFKKMWPKLLEACAIEAISEKKESIKVNNVTPQQVTKWLNEVESVNSSKITRKGKMEFNTRDSEKNVLYETSTNGRWIHKNMIKK